MLLSVSFVALLTHPPSSRRAGCDRCLLFAGSATRLLLPFAAGRSPALHTGGQNWSCGLAPRSRSAVPGIGFFGLSPVQRFVVMRVIKASCCDKSPYLVELTAARRAWRAALPRSPAIWTLCSRALPALGLPWKPWEGIQGAFRAKAGPGSPGRSARLAGQCRARGLGEVGQRSLRARPRGRRERRVLAEPGSPLVPGLLAPLPPRQFLSVSPRCTSRGPR